MQNGRLITPMFNLRVTPWFTDSCVIFLNNLFKWLPSVVNYQLTLLEFGGGNSTLYFLQKKLKVVTIESDDGFITMLSDMANQLGYKSIKIQPENFNDRTIIDNDLVIVKALDISNLDHILNKDWSIIVNDGIARKQVLEGVLGNKFNPIVILDNVEYCANWGRLDRSSAKPDLIYVYRSMLRSPDWQRYIFEQQHGREGHGSPDFTGWESPHRWASAVLWKNSHVLNKFIISNIGLPVVNKEGLDDEDLFSLSERCPFDWEKMVWLKENFPKELDLGLERNFN